MADGVHGRNYLALLGKISLVLIIVLCIFLFLHAAVVRVATDIGVAGQAAGNLSASGSPVISVLTLGFLILFLGGVCYAFWILLVQHYIALSLTRDWVVEILKETEDASSRIDERQRFAA